MTYIYQDYLQRWKEQYGDAAWVQARWYKYGKERTTVIHRLSENEFGQSLNIVDRCYRALDVEMADDSDDRDNNAIDALFEEAFPHELRLLF